MIGVFDSGYGGLSVLREVQALLPTHNLAYFADTAFCPYGPKSIAFVRSRSLDIASWLFEHGARVIVVACNTASSAALELLRARLPVPIVGVEPGLKPAVAATHNGRVGVLATSNTLKGQRFATLVERYGGSTRVFRQPCPGLVEQIEAGCLEDDTTEALVRLYVEPLLEHGVDTLVLGCTHYPFVGPLIRHVAGPQVTIIDTGPAIARQVQRIVEQHTIASGSGMVHAYTSGDPVLVAPVISRLLGRAVPVEVVLPDL